MLLTKQQRTALYKLYLRDLQGDNGPTWPTYAAMRRTAQKEMARRYGFQ